LKAFPNSGEQLLTMVFVGSFIRLARWFSLGNAGISPFNRLRNQQQRDFFKDFLAEFHGRAAPVGG
jgi:hypothetical protein